MFDDIEAHLNPLGFRFYCVPGRCPQIVSECGNRFDFVYYGSNFWMINPLPPSPWGIKQKNGRWLNRNGSSILLLSEAETLRKVLSACIPPDCCPVDLQVIDRLKELM